MPGPSNTDSVSFAQSGDISIFETYISWMTPNSLKTSVKNIKLLVSRLFMATSLPTTRLIFRIPCFLWFKPKNTILLPTLGFSTWCPWLLESFCTWCSGHILKEQPSSLGSWSQNSSTHNAECKGLYLWDCKLLWNNFHIVLFMHFVCAYPSLVNNKHAK